MAVPSLVSYAHRARARSGDGIYIPGRGGNGAHETGKRNQALRCCAKVKKVCLKQPHAPRSSVWKVKYARGPNVLVMQRRANFGGRISFNSSALQTLNFGPYDLGASGEVGALHARLNLKTISLLRLGMGVVRLSSLSRNFAHGFLLKSSRNLTFTNLVDLNSNYSQSSKPN